MSPFLPASADRVERLRVEALTQRCIHCDGAEWWYLDSYMAFLICFACHQPNADAKARPEFRDLRGAT